MNFIIFELQHKGFSDKAIHAIINDIFASYNISQDNIISTNFPHSFEFPKEPIQENKEKYYKNLKEYMDSLTHQDRIESLKNYFNSKAFSVKFIFRINGIKGKEYLPIGDIELYNPIQKQLIKQESDNKKEYDETFGFKDFQSYENEVCNIAIKEHIIDKDSKIGKQKAILKANAFVDCLLARRFFINTKITLNTTQYIVLDDKNKRIATGFSLSKVFLPYRHSKYIKEFINNSDKNYLEYYLRLLKQDDLIGINKQIKDSLNWKRKAMEATNYNEAILWYWVSIENLFNSENGATKLIFDFAPKILTQVYIHHFIGQTYTNILDRAFSFGDDNISHKAREIMKNTLQNMPKNMTHKEFIEKVKEICENFNKNSFFYDRLQDFREKFEKKGEFKKFIEKYKKQIEQELIFLYRIRNKIVHNASNEYIATITYYKNFAAYISTSLTCYFIDKRILGCKSNDEIMNRGEYEYSIMLFNLEKCDTESLLLEYLQSVGYA